MKYLKLTKIGITNIVMIVCFLLGIMAGHNNYKVTLKNKLESETTVRLNDTYWLIPTAKGEKLVVNINERMDILAKEVQENERSKQKQGKR